METVNCSPVIYAAQHTYTLRKPLRPGSTGRRVCIAQINHIHLLRGMIGKPGAGVLQMHGQSTAQNNRECGADGDLPTRPIFRPNGLYSSQPTIAGGCFRPPTVDLTLAVSAIGCRRAAFA